MRILKSLVIASAVLLGVVLSPTMASACYSGCFFDQYGCGECRTVSYFTGGGCEQAAPCVCNFVQECCFGGCWQASAPDSLPFAKPEANQCPASTSASAPAATVSTAL